MVLSSPNANLLIREGVNVVRQELPDALASPSSKDLELDVLAPGYFKVHPVHFFRGPLILKAFHQLHLAGRKRRCSFHNRAAVVVFDATGQQKATISIPSKEGEILSATNIAINPGTKDAYVTASGKGGGWIHTFTALAEGIRQSNGGWLADGDIGTGNRPAIPSGGGLFQISDRLLIAQIAPSALRASAPFSKPSGPGTIENVCGLVMGEASR